MLQTEPDIVVPMILMYSADAVKRPARIVVAVSQSSKESFLRERSTELADLVAGGAVVCLPDLRDVGTQRGSCGEGSNGSTEGTTRWQ